MIDLVKLFIERARTSGDDVYNTAADALEAQAKEIERLRKLIKDALDDQEGDWDFLKWNLIRGLEP